MKISHESPISLLQNSLKYNDYDYCLVHLLDKHPEYRDFFKKSSTLNREILLDCSTFELGVAFDADKFAKEIEDLKPTYYIVPDVLEDGYQTMVSFDGFLKNFKELPGLKIGVVQGKTYDELTDCYKYMSEYADYIAISFDYSYYLVTGTGKTKLNRWCTGRHNFVRMLIGDGLWRFDKPVHMLGCSLPQEFKQYVGIPNIRSLDTSNPVMAGIKGLKYAGNLGLQTKPEGKLADHITHKPTPDEIELIEYNIKAFSEIARRY